MNSFFSFSAVPMQSPRVLVRVADAGMRCTRTCTDRGTHLLIANNDPLPTHELPTRQGVCVLEVLASEVIISYSSTYTWTECVPVYKY